MPRIRTTSDDVSRTWPDRQSAAVELTVLLGETITAATLHGWATKGCEALPAGGGEIDKATLVRWIMLERRGPGRPGGAPDPAKDRAAIAQAKIWEAKAKREDARWVLREEVEADGMRAVEALRRRLADAATRAGQAVVGKSSVDAATVIGLEIGSALDAAAADLVTPAAKATTP